MPSLAKRKWITKKSDKKVVATEKAITYVTKNGLLPTEALKLCDNSCSKQALYKALEKKKREFVSRLVASRKNKDRKSIRENKQWRRNSCYTSG